MKSSLVDGDQQNRNYQSPMKEGNTCMCVYPESLCKIYLSVGHDPPKKNEEYRSIDSTENP